MNQTHIGRRETASFYARAHQRSTLMVLLITRVPWNIIRALHRYRGRTFILQNILMRTYCRAVAFA